MIKTMSLLHRKTGMKPGAFADRYEAVHVPLVQQLLGPLRDYRRNYVLPDRAGTFARPNFDVLTMIRFDDQAGLAALGAKLAVGDAGARITADEIEMFDRARMAMFLIEEQVISGPEPEAIPAAAAGAKFVLVCARDPAMPRDAFSARIGEECARLAERFRQGRSGADVSSIVCNLIPDGGIFDLGHIEGHHAAVDFDVLIEIRLVDRSGGPALVEALDRLSASIFNAAGRASSTRRMTGFFVGERI